MQKDVELYRVLYLHRRQVVARDSNWRSTTWCATTYGLSAPRQRLHVAMFEGNYREYEIDLKRRKGVDAETPHRIKYKALVRG